MITTIQQKLIFEKILPSKSIGEILHELRQELNQLKAELIGQRDFSNNLKILRNYLDESKTSNSYDSHSIRTEKVRFDTEQIQDHDNTTSRSRSNTNRTANNYRFRRQQRLSDSSFNISSKKRTEKIQIREALSILEPYYARYRTRCNSKIEMNWNV
jgi:hypothetical protein